MNPPTHNRYRVPFHVTPGDNHKIVLQFTTSQVPYGYGAVMVDAETGATVIAYTWDGLNGAAGVETFKSTTANTAALNPAKAYEVRIFRTTPEVHTLISGPVVFPPTTVPVAA